MRYRLTIRKIEANENFAVQKAEYEEKNRYGRMNRDFDGRYEPGYPQEEIITDALIVELNEEQFKKIKELSFKTFE